MLLYLTMVMLAYTSYRLGKALWVRAVGAPWYILPALAAYIFGLWLLLIAIISTRGAALLFAVALIAGIFVNAWLRRRSLRAADTGDPEAQR